MLAAASLIGTACTVDGTGDEFGVPTGASSVTAGTGSPQTGSSGSSDSGSQDGASSDGGTASGSSTAGDSTGADGSTSGASGDSSTGVDDAATEQPQMGMYSACAEPNDCVAPSNLCFTLDMMKDGFCTNMGCVDPLVDCDPTPGGTAVPICFPVELDKVPQDSCALDCAGGQVCPTGMSCVALAEGTICG